MLKFKTIYADPPWAEHGGGQIQRGAEKHYPLMKTKDIMSLPIQQYIEDNAHCYLWVTNNFLEDGLQVLKAWGFRYITNVAWIKGKDEEHLDRLGLGQYFRGCHELCLFGVKGNLPYKTREDGKRAQGRTVLFESKREHSQKPLSMINVIETVSYPNYLEMFAREHNGRTNWYFWGNEVNKDISL